MQKKDLHKCALFIEIKVACLFFFAVCNISYTYYTVTYIPRSH